MPNHSNQLISTPTHLNTSSLESHLWEAANILRGSPVDRADWKSYILPVILQTHLWCLGWWISRNGWVLWRRLCWWAPFPGARWMPLEECAWNSHKCRYCFTERHAGNWGSQSETPLRRLWWCPVDQQRPLTRCAGGVPLREYLIVFCKHVFYQVRL